MSDFTSRLDFARLLDQRHRLMQVQTALPALSLIPERMVFREAVSQPFELRLQCLSTSAHLELKTLLGEQISLKLLQSDGAYVPWHGYVFEAAQLGADGGLARYALTMRPWLSALVLRRNSRVFHDQTALQVIDAVLADHQPQANWRFEVSEPLRVRSLCTQYRETDLAFVQRLLAAEGLSYHFEHLDGQAASDADAAMHARHVMVITDRLAQRPALGTVRFTSQHATASLGGQQDSITAFMAQRDLAPNAVTLAAWDYKRLSGVSAQDNSTLALGELPALEVYDGSGAYRYEHPEHAQRAAALALPVHTEEVLVQTGQPCPVFGIYEPLVKDGLMTYMCAGQEAYRYGERCGAPGGGNPVTWKLIWEDTRYLDGGRPPLAPGAGACGAINDTSSTQGTTRFISSRNSRLRVLLVLRSNPLSPRLICFMPSMSHIGPGVPVLCRPSLDQIASGRSGQPAQYTGTWAAMDDLGGRIFWKKGEPLPLHNGREVEWVFNGI